MSGKYWDMYKGKTSYDQESDLGEEEQDTMREIDEEEGEEEGGHYVARQTPEAYQPIEPQIKEERKLSNKAKEMLKKWGEKRFKKPKATASTAKKTVKPVASASNDKGKQGQKEVIISYKVNTLVASK